MGGIWRWVTGLLLLSSLGLGGPLTPVAGAQTTPTLITPGPLLANPQASTDGRSVAWIAGDQVVVWALGDRQRRVVATSNDTLHQVAVEDDRVIWLERRQVHSTRPSRLTSSAGIFAISLSTGAITPIVQLNDFQTEFSLSNGRLTWWYADHGQPPPAVRQLQVRDLRTSQPIQTLYRLPVDPGITLTRPVWYGDHLLWLETPTYPTAQYWRLWTLRVDGSQAEPTLLTSGDSWAALLDVGGELALLTTPTELVAVRLTTGARQTITTGPVNGATTDGRQIFWGDTLSRSSLVWGLQPLHRYDIETGCYWRFEPAGAPSGLPQTRNGLLIWQRQIERGVELHGGMIEQLVADYPTIQVCQPLPQRRFFPETGQTLDTFREFWEQGGGLPVFGYPLSIELMEQRTDTGQQHIVQYFERQRLEYHPNLRRTAYAVQLGRLGAEEAQRRGLLSHPAFRPLPATPSPGAGCRHFAETGHWLCGDFQQYWEGHGLELGDPAISLREALALFGYPLSEPFVEPGTGLLVQYFERARFELHPNNLPEWRVLLTRLGESRVRPG